MSDSRKVKFERKDTLLHNLNPMTKIIGLIWICMFTLLVPGYTIQTLLFIGLILLSVQSQCQERIVQLSVVILLPLLLFLVCVHGFLHPSNKTIVWDAHILGMHLQMGQEGLDITYKLVSKLAVILSSVFIFVSTTDPELMMSDFNQRKVSPFFSYMFLATLNMVPQMRQRMETVRIAQEARGVQTTGSFKIRMRALLPMLMPLILSSLMDISDRATTLEVRAFASSNSPSSLYDIVETDLDKKLKNGFLITLVIMILLKLFG